MHPAAMCPPHQYFCPNDIKRSPHGLPYAYGLKPKVWGRAGPDPRAELQVDPAPGRQAEGLGRPGNTSLCVASPEQANSHSSDMKYHGEQGYNKQLSCESADSQTDRHTDRTDFIAGWPTLKKRLIKEF